MNDPTTKELSTILRACAPVIGLLSAKHAEVATIMQACAERLDVQEKLLEQHAAQIEALEHKYIELLACGQNNN